MKKCASKECDQLNPQPLINFWKNKSTKDGLSIHCKVCNKKYIKKTGIKYREKYNEKKKLYREINKDRYKKMQKECWLNRQYGINTEDYNSMFLYQKGKCKICNIHSSEFKKPLAVDHCHKTKKVRGLLCYHCNWMIGHARDNDKILESAIKYLRGDE